MVSTRTKRVKFEDLLPDSHDMIMYLRVHPMALFKLIEPTEEQVMAACVSGTPVFYRALPQRYMTYRVQRVMITRSPSNAKYIDDLDHSIMRQMVCRNGKTLRWINDPPNDIKLLACMRTGSAIKFIDNPTPAMQLAAVKNSIKMINYIENPSDEVKNYVFQRKMFGVTS